MFRNYKGMANFGQWNCPGRTTRYDAATKSSPSRHHSTGTMLTEHEFEIRVRYQETDAQGHVHHANYLNYFEVGRVELLRAAGHDYRQLEADGIFLVVTEVSCNYFLPAKYDDHLTLRTTTVRSKGVRIEHCYRLLRGDELLAEGRTVVACVTHDGTVQRLPGWLRIL